MSSLNEHMAEQAAITARYDALTAIGTLAHDLGAEIETCEDTEAALAFCAARQDEMTATQLRTLDEARNDDAEDRATDLLTFAEQIADLASYNCRLLRREHLSDLFPIISERVEQSPGDWAVLDASDETGGLCFVGDDPSTLAQRLLLKVAPAPQPEAQKLPFTVLFMIPDWKRGDQSHESDHICRVWTEATDPENAVEAAKEKLPEDLHWEEYDVSDLDDYSPVAVYPGHIFDLFQA
jgi:hypothetical protein